MSTRSNFDLAHGAPVIAEALRALEDAGVLGGNPASVHQAGQRARRLVEGAQQTLRTWLGAADARRILLVGSTFEAELLLLVGLRAAGKPTAASPLKQVLWVGPEAADCDGHRRALNAWGCTLTVLPLRQALSQGGLPRAAPDGTAWARIMVNGAHDGCGTLAPLHRSSPWQPVLDATPWALHLGPRAMLWPDDAGQRLCRFDATVVSGGPLGAPMGATAVLLQQDATVTPLMQGGGQQDGLRPGTVAKEVAHALATAIDHRPAPRAFTELAPVRDALEAWATSTLGARVCPSPSGRLPHMAVLHLPQTNGQPLPEALWRKRIAATMRRCLCGAQGLHIGLHPSHHNKELERLQSVLSALCKPAQTCAKEAP